MARHTIDYVFETATSDEGMTTANAIRFHCFNPNGAYARLKAMHRRIDAWVEAHPERPNGVLFVHGSLNDHPHNMLFKVLKLHKQGKAHKWPLRQALQWIDRAIEKGDAFINDPAEWPATKAELAERAAAGE